MVKLFINGDIRAARLRLLCPACASYGGPTMASSINKAISDALKGVQLAAPCDFRAISKGFKLPPISEKSQRE